MPTSMAASTSGTSGTMWATRPIATTCRASARSSAGRRRQPAATIEEIVRDDAADADLERRLPPSEGDPGQRQADPRPCWASSSPDRPWMTGTSPRSSTRRAPSVSAIEHMRSHRAVCKGAVVWQFNDCWPVTSWAALDSAGRRKPLWYAMQQAFDPRLLTIRPHAGGLAAVAVNERTLFWRAKISRQAPAAGRNGACRIRVLAAALRPLRSKGISATG